MQKTFALFTLFVVAFSQIDALRISPEADPVLLTFLTLRGTVRNSKDGRAVPVASLSLVAEATNRVEATFQSDTNGVYSFGQYVAGVKYNLVYNADFAFERFSAPVDVSQSAGRGVNLEININLTPKSSVPPTLAFVNVNGVVKNSRDGKAIPNAVLTIVADSTNTVVDTIKADQNGAYAFAQYLAVGKYNIVYNSDQLFERSSSSIEVPSSGYRAELNINLTPKGSSAPLLSFVHLNGTVRNAKDKKVVPNAMLSLVEQSTNTVAATFKADHKGYYALGQYLPAIKYNIVYKADRTFKTFSALIDVSQSSGKGFFLEYNVNLTPKN